MELKNFKLVTPVKLFNAQWSASSLRTMSNEDMIQIGDFGYDVVFPGGRHIQRDYDVYGIPWTIVPRDAWNPNLKTNDALYRLLATYPVAYLRIGVSVHNGAAGDSILFLINQPNTKYNSGCYAAVHVEVISEDPRAIGKTMRSTAVAQNFLPGFSVLAEMKNPTDAFNYLYENTVVSFWGVHKTEKIILEARCDFIGGFTSNGFTPTPE